MQLREGLVDSFSKADIDRLLTFLDKDVVVTWQNGEVSHGPEAVRAYYHRMMSGENRIVREIKTTPEIVGRQSYGGWAVSWGNLHDTITLMDGSVLPFNSAFTITTAKRGDRWLVTAYHASINAFENPVLGLALRKTALWTSIGGILVGFLAGYFIARTIAGRKSVSGA
jgi:ketosteroid isomerase-like protein